MICLLQRCLTSLLILLLLGCAGPGGSTQGPVPNSADVSRNRAKVHTELGMAYLGGGQLNVALDEARIALNADSSYPLAYNLLGLAHMQMKENARAEEYFDQALRLAPSDPEINNNAGSFFCQTGREDRAFTYFDAAAGNPLNSTPARPLVNAGICAARLKEYKRAEDYLTRALRLDAGALDGLYTLAEVLLQQGRHGEARLRLLEIHRRAEPSAASAWLALRIERKLGDREAEAHWMNQLRRKFSDSQEYRKLTQGAFE